MEEAAKSYATALFRLAKPEERENYLDALRSVQGLFQSFPELKKALESYALSLGEKDRLILDVFPSISSLPHFTDFFRVLNRHHRMSLLPEVEEAYASLVHASLGVEEGAVYSTYPLSQEELEDMEQAFSAKLGVQVELKPYVDPDLLGGAKVALQGKVYDGTLRHKLQELKDHLLQGGKQ